ncbi:hypothetical protein PENTCL1PPCAC_5778 [Pristionchus entomophagus]|uniref:MADF domain-containing protein n=1 Tax=Pristionchus entomophagus TaxID=358040 RepID=A0AAV5SND3_9BILA|nr:hypothetical protein PENTCL1PPCAC_5778 [Pristionchus entomophagus]
MHNNNAPNAPKATGIMRTIRSSGRPAILRQESILSRPSTSSPVERKNKRFPTISPQMISGRYEFNSRLIDLVKQRRYLYDGITPGGRSATFRLQVWDGLARMLDFEQGGFQLAKRWKQIRDKYVKERRIIGDRIEKHGPLAPFQQSNWPLYGKLSFLIPFIAEREQDRPMSADQKSYLRPRAIVNSEDSETFNRRVINAVRCKPVLYSKSDPHYHTSAKRIAAWQDVVTELGYPCDTTEMQRFWKAIRDKYIRIRRSLSDPCDSSSSSQSSRKDGSKWVHYQDLAWLEPYLEYQQRVRQEFALARQAADRARRGLVAIADEDNGVEVDYEVDRADMELSLLYDDQTQLLESGVRFDGDTAFAASVIADIRSLPDDRQEEVRAQIQLALDGTTRAAEMREKMQQERKRRKIMMGVVKMEEEEDGWIGDVSREETVTDTIDE